jgi:GNAT superfamily N-acetyltransferase
VTLNVVSTAERPELVPTVAGWVWAEFRRGHGYTLEQTLASVSVTVTARDLPQTYILLADGRPVGTASLAEKDLEERPELTPWLAGVFVEPESRGRGYAGRLTAHVEGVCRGRSIATLWLYTRTAERIYARSGWRTVESVEHNGKTYALMRRDLIG